MLTFDSMEVKLLKDHELGLQGDDINISPEMANYLVRCKVAEYVKPKIDFDIIPVIGDYQIKVANLTKS